MDFTIRSIGGKPMPNKATNKPDSEAKKAWMQNNCTKMTIKFMNKGDDDILVYMQGKKKATVIKKALRLLMESEGIEYINKKQSEAEEDDE